MPDVERLISGGANARPRPGRGRPPRHNAHARRTHPLARAVAVALVFVLAFATSVVGLTWGRVNQNIDTREIDDLLGTSRPTPSGSPAPTDINRGRALNLLVIGSDSREGENDVDGAGATGTTSGMRSDTTMLVHISADRSRVEVVSIPRDTLVDIPACTLPDGTMTAPQSDAMFNSAFQTGGEGGDIGSAAACTILTVEELTGLYVDDFAVVDFAGFINVIDALGGVAMYIPEDIDDQLAGLQLEQGCRLLNGDEALGFARVRKTVEDGSDISRIGRQQDLVLAIIQEALSTNLLRNPPRLYRFLDTSTQTLTTGNRIGDVRALAGLGTSLASIRSDDITLVTMPFEWAGARVIPSWDYVNPVWESLQGDLAIDPIYSGDAWEITVALREREAAAAAPPPESADAPTDPSPSSGPTTVDPPTTDPADDPLMCTKETAS